LKHALFSAAAACGSNTNPIFLEGRLDMKNILIRAVTILMAGLIVLSPATVSANSGAFVGPFNTVTSISTTVPANGDVNPYGVAVVPRSTGALVKGDVLVSNFNSSANTQGTGTTIVQVAPGGSMSLFAQINPKALPGACPGGVGLTTALVVLRQGWVIVGSLPTQDGSAATSGAGCLIVLNRWGHAVETFSGSMINGPWDMTAVDRGNNTLLFVTNVLNGTVAASPNVVNHGTVVRFLLSQDDHDMPRVVKSTVIGSGFGERTDPAALVVGPTGVGVDKDGTLFVADSLANRVAAIPNALTRHTSAGTGHTVSVGGALNTPLGLAVAPNGDVLVVNANDGNLVEITPGGKQVAVKMVDISGAGAGTLFGLAVVPGGKGIYLVNDGNNTLDVFN
jgi:hypothetical protein